MNDNQAHFPKTMDDLCVSRFLSLVLRHEPEKIGLRLDAAGWADVPDLLARCGAMKESFGRRRAGIAKRYWHGVSLIRANASSGLVKCEPLLVAARHDFIEPLARQRNAVARRSPPRVWGYPREDPSEARSFRGDLVVEL